MLINFNIEKLDRLLYDFHCLTGLTISVWDAEFHQLSYQPKEIRSFCRKIKETPIGRTRCFLSDKQICMECGKTGKPATHYCHAGLIDTAVPIKFKNTILGYIMFGQISDGTDSDILKGLTKLGKELGIDHKELIEVYKELDIYNEEKIEALTPTIKEELLKNEIDLSDELVDEASRFLLEELEKDNVEIETMTEEDVYNILDKIAAGEITIPLP